MNKEIDEARAAKKAGLELKKEIEDLVNGFTARGFSSVIVVSDPRFGSLHTRFYGQREALICACAQITRDVGMHFIREHSLLCERVRGLGGEP